MSKSVHEHVGAEARVDPAEYTEEYYLNDCEGYDAYRESSGRRLTSRLGTVFEMADVRQGQWVLDIACGRGEIVLQSALRGAQAIGLDYAEAATKLTQQTIRSCTDARAGRMGVVRMDATKLAFPTAKFDTIFMVDFVEHLYPHELEQSLAEAYRVLKPSGRLVIHTAPNRLFARVAWPRYVRHVHRAALSLARRFNFQDQFINPMMLPQDEEFPLEGDYEHVHVNEQTPDGLASIVRRTGFQSVKMSVKEPRTPPLYRELRYKLEVKLLDMFRFLWPLNRVWPVNRLFSNHIWVTARRP